MTDLDDDSLGESAYSRRTPAERLAEIVAQDLIELVGAVTRRIEKMTSDLLFTGSIQLPAGRWLDRDAALRHDHADRPERHCGMPRASDPIKDLSSAANTDHRQLGPRARHGGDGQRRARGIPEQPRSSQEQLNKLHIVAGGISPTAPQGVGTAQFIGTLYPAIRVDLRLRRDIRGRGDATRSSR